MKEVTVRTLDLIKILEENRDQHRETFLKAQAGYRRKLIEELDKMLKEAREGTNLRSYIALPQPEDHTEDYQRVIYMLKLHTEETVTLGEQEAAQYVMDDWGWKRQWTTTNETYNIR